MSGFIYQKYVDLKQALTVIADTSFTLVKVVPFCEEIRIMSYRKVGSITVKEELYALYEHGIESSYNFKHDNGVAGCGGVLGSQNIVEEATAVLHRTVPVISIFYKKPDNEIWYICKTPYLTSFPITVIQGDIRLLLEEFYNLQKKAPVCGS